jgi:hypothetical protein
MEIAMATLLPWGLLLAPLLYVVVASVVSSATFRLHPVVPPLPRTPPPR